MELPEELMTLILLKLPVKSLLRFKCVEKSWYSLISSPYFIRLHRYSSTSSINNDCFIVCRFHLEGHVLSLHSYETLELCGNQINIPFSLEGGVELCGSCDGLVCLSNFNDTILICNPTIREFRSLVFPLPRCNEFGYYIASVAFGSDPITGKYTVLTIVVPFGYDNFDEDINCGDGESWLYDLSSDSWRETAVAFPPGQFDYSHRAVSLNGAFHWCPWGSNSNSIHGSNILTFHISNEVTGSIPVPDSVVGVAHEKELCVSTKSQLSLILYDREEGRLEIYVMNEYGVKESWTRLFKIRPLPLKVFRPITFWDEQRLLLKDAARQLVSCDLQHQNLRHFPIDGHFDLSPCSQSLVSVHGIGNSII